MRLDRVFIQDANKVIFKDYHKLLKEMEHYTVILKPSLLFMTPYDFRIQFYAAMYLLGGFKDHQVAKELFKSECKINERLEKLYYDDFYMPHDPFQNAQYWNDISSV